MMKTILCFGNEFVENDSIAKNLADDLKIEGIRFRKCNKVEDVLRFREGHPDEELLIMDVVKGISCPVLIDDLSKIKTTESITLHDFDLAFFLKLLETTGQLGKVRIIGIPMEGDLGELKKEIRSMIKKMVP